MRAGRQQIRGPPAPPCTGALGRGGQHRAGARAGKAGGRHPVKGSEPDFILPGHEPVQGALQGQRRDHHGEHGFHCVPRRPGGLHTERHFRELAGEGDHLHADGQPHKGPVGKLRAQHPEAGPGAPYHERDHHHARGQVPATA